MLSPPHNEDLKNQLIQGDGIIFLYSPQKQFAYRTNVKSNKYLIFIDGMYGNMLNIPYFTILKKYCDSNNIVLVCPQLRSHPHYKLHPIQHDVQDLQSLITILNGQIILLGSSTGCQDCLLYAQAGKSPKVKGMILQAPASDVQYIQMFDPNLKQSIALAKQSKQKFFTYKDQIWLTQRFLSVNQERNKQDLFSSYLEETLFQQWKVYGPILSIISKKDIYCQKDLSQKFKLMGSVVILEQAEHQINNLEAQKQFIKVVDAFLKQITFI